MKPINTLADFKRAVEIGVKVSCTYHMEFNGRDENNQPTYRDKVREPRECTRKQSNSFALKTTKEDGKVVDSWCSWPKATEVKISGNKVTIYEDDFRNPGAKIPVLTYWIED